MTFKLRVTVVSFALLVSCSASSLDLASIMLLCSSLPMAAGNIIVDDQWTFGTTNAQTIIGAIGVLTMTFNFISGELFYRLTQRKLKHLLEDNIQELEQRKDLKTRDNERITRAFEALDSYINKQTNEFNAEIPTLLDSLKISHSRDFFVKEIIR